MLACAALLFGNWEKVAKEVAERHKEEEQELERIKWEGNEFLTTNPVPLVTVTDRAAAFREAELTPKSVLVPTPRAREFELTALPNVVPQSAPSASRAASRSVKHGEWSVNPVALAPPDSKAQQHEL